MIISTKYSLPKLKDEYRKTILAQIDGRVISARRLQTLLDDAMMWLASVERRPTFSSPALELETILDELRKLRAASCLGSYENTVAIRMLEVPDEYVRMR